MPWCFLAVFVVLSIDKILFLFYSLRTIIISCMNSNNNVLRFETGPIPRSEAADFIRSLVPGTTSTDEDLVNSAYYDGDREVVTIDIPSSSLSPERDPIPHNAELHQALLDLGLPRYSTGGHGSFGVAYIFPMKTFRAPRPSPGTSVEGVEGVTNIADHISGRAEDTL